MGFEDEMAQYDDHWESEQKKSGIIPDGEYSGAVITDTVIDERDDRFSISFRFTVEGEGSVRKWWNLDTEEKIGWAARDFKRLGYEGRLSELRAAVENGDFLGLVCRIKVETKAGDTRDYTNVYVNAVEGKSAETVGSKAGPVDDDIPFEPTGLYSGRYGI